MAQLQCNAPTGAMAQTCYSASPHSALQLPKTKKQHHKAKVVL